ncbi:hypothetical protein J7E88_05555 [Streptomyces sp. ISL-10]|uniref:hypothetical protein n=1 Tax=Streptomyces sp. ISL-10 TaxID=2819172 RepID=UPI001BEB02DC|nr:hypothetical protein [Streptomyces sp. ISL-10]MBT2364798.1 hypothetical protein [Streptomyces sp. ISL-10]
MCDRALVLPGLVPLTASNVDAVLGVHDEHLALAAHVCGFEPGGTGGQQDSSTLTTTVHEALLAVAVIRRLEQEPQRRPAYGGLSAGCVTALLAAGVLDEADCFRIIREVNSRQIEAHRTGRSGTTLAVLAPSEDDARRLVEEMRSASVPSWLSVDLGGGLVAISVGDCDIDAVRARLGRLGVVVLDQADRAEHSPCTVPGPDELAGILAGVEFRTASAVVISPLTGKPVDNSPEAFRRMLVDQSFDTVSLPRLVDGLCAVDGVAAVDLIAPAKSVYVTRTRSLLQGRAEHRLLTLAG